MRSLLPSSRSFGALVRHNGAWCPVNGSSKRLEERHFYEGPDDVHIVGRNASQTAPAKFLVFLVKDKGAPVLTPIK